MIDEKPSEGKTRVENKVFRSTRLSSYRGIRNVDRRWFIRGKQSRNELTRVEICERLTRHVWKDEWGGEKDGNL